MSNKVKVLVTLTESGTIEVCTPNPDDVDVMVVEYGISEEPEIYVALNPFASSVVLKTSQLINDRIDNAIDVLKKAVDRCTNDDETSEDDIADWIANIERLTSFRIV